MVAILQMTFSLAFRWIKILVYGPQVVAVALSVYFGRVRSGARSESRTPVTSAQKAMISLPLTIPYK